VSVRVRRKERLWSTDSVTQRRQGIKKVGEVESLDGWVWWDKGETMTKKKDGKITEKEQIPGEKLNFMTTVLGNGIADMLFLFEQKTGVEVLALDIHRRRGRTCNHCQMRNIKIVVHVHTNYPGRLDPDNVPREHRHLVNVDLERKMVKKIVRRREKSSFSSGTRKRRRRGSDAQSWRRRIRDTRKLQKKWGDVLTRNGFSRSPFGRRSGCVLGDSGIGRKISRGLKQSEMRTDAIE